VGELQPLIERLESVAADIDDLAFDRLSAAVADGEVERPADDKALMQARRAIEKAALVLRRIEGAESDVEQGGKQ
jgi:hypothetical protein